MPAPEREARDVGDVRARERFAAGEAQFADKARGGKEAAQVGKKLLFVKLRQGGALGAELFAVGALAGAARGDAEAHAAERGPASGHTGAGEAVRRAARAQSKAAHNGGAQAAKATARPALAGAEGPGRLRRGQHAHALCPA